MSRELDVVLWGATGFTGRLVAEYLARYAPSSLRWAIGGRSEPDLRALFQRLAQHGGRTADAIVIADSHERRSLDAMTTRTRVIASTVGPFAQLGSELVASCVHNGTDYCDLAGEVPWVRMMIDRHHDDARAARVRIVPCCGFDSVPSDLGALCVQRRAIARFGQPASRIHTEVRRFKGGVSGGTLASIANIADAARRDKNTRRVLADARSLSPPHARSGPRMRRQLGVHKGPKGWTAPFLMASVNEKVVQRSNALLFANNQPFTYDEVSQLGPGLLGWARAVRTAAYVAATLATTGVHTLRRLLVGRVLPAPGQGPSREEIERGRFEMEVLAEVGDQQIACTVQGGDPGYGEAAKMLAEATLCLACDTPAEVLPGGVLTPASALGMTLVARLRAAGIRFHLTES